jgi:hypothetical protein
LQVAWQESETFAGFDRRAHQHDLPNGLPLQRGNGHGNRQVRFTRPRWTAAKHDPVAADGVEVAGLARGAGANRLPSPEYVDGRAFRGYFTVLNALEDPVDVLGGDHRVALGQMLQLLDDLGGAYDRRFIALDKEATVAGRDAYPESLANAAQVPIARAE